MAMIKVVGKTVYKAIARGPIFVMDKQEAEITGTTVADVEAEVARVTEAIEVAKAQIGKLYEKALAEVGEESAAIFEVHQMMLDDDDYNESIEEIITFQSGYPAKSEDIRYESSLSFT